MQHLFEFSFTSYFGETQKNPKCVKERKRERERKKRQRENKVFYYFFLKKMNSCQKIKIKNR